MLKVCVDFYVLVVEGSRFQFSHDFSNLLLTQVIDYLDGDKEMGYYLRYGYNSSGKQIQWPDMFAATYISRPTELKNVSCFDFVKDYEVKYDGKGQKKKEVKTATTFHFIGDHPGRLYAYIIRRTLF